MNLDICKNCKRFPPKFLIIADELNLICINQESEEIDVILAQDGKIEDEKKIKHLYKDKLYPKDYLLTTDPLCITDIKDKDIINRIEIGKDCPYCLEHMVIKDEH